MTQLINVDLPLNDIEFMVLNDDQVGYLFSECMRKLSNKKQPLEDEIEAANLELENLGVKICKTF
mgnify:CR=1 FL=1